MLTAFIKFGDGRVSTEATEDVLKQAMRDDRAVFWLDMECPSDDEVGLLDEVFGFHPLAIEDTIKYAQRPKIESYTAAGDAAARGYFYMVIHGPDVETFKQKLRTKEVDVFVSQNYLVTVHDEKFRSVCEVRDRAVSDPRLVLDQGIDMLLYQILDKLVDHYLPILEYIQEALDDLEEEAAQNPTAELLTRISAKKRELLDLRRVIGPQREVLAQLTRGEVPFIRESTRLYLRDVLDHLVRAVETIELYRDLILGARDIYMSSVSNNLNRIMKTLTVITVIALPLNVITGFFGMNFDAVPGLHSRTAFWTTVGVMIVGVAGMLGVARYKRWI
jgi:magnesium transporter